MKHLFTLLAALAAPVVCLLLLLSFPQPGHAFAAEPPPPPASRIRACGDVYRAVRGPSLADYLRTREVIARAPRQAADSQALLRLFEMGNAVEAGKRRLLEQDEFRDRDPCCDDENRERQTLKLPGFKLVHHASCSWLAWDLKSLQAFAQEHGSNADRDFFRILALNYPDGEPDRPVYMEPFADESSCILHGPELIDFPQRLMRHLQSFPTTPYRAWIMNTLRAQAEEALYFRNSCHTKARTEASIRRFREDILKRWPGGAPPRLEDRFSRWDREYGSR